MDLTSLDDYELAMLYNGLCQLAGSEAGRRYLHNCDPSHPAYSPRRPGTIESDATWGDGPATNHLFRIGETMHRECISRSVKFFDKQLGVEFASVFANWENFCECVRRGQATRRSS